MSHIRPTNMAEAFINAAVKAGVGTGKVDHQTGKGSWLARKVVINATERSDRFGTVYEPDRLPQRER